MNMKPHQPPQYLYKRIVQAKLFMDTHYADDIDLRHISGSAHFSRFHFLRLFKKIYGRTPHQYLVAVRVEAAKRQLEAGLNATATCMLVGFSSTGSFTTLFKKQTGCTPAQYRSDFLKRKARIQAAPLQFIPACFAAKKGWL
jgi:AraC-like DNA-binding protein